MEDERREVTRGQIPHTVLVGHGEESRFYCKRSEKPWEDCEQESDTSDQLLKRSSCLWVANRLNRGKERSRAVPLRCFQGHRRVLLLVL